jgi:hypothetical protein
MLVVALFIGEYGKHLINIAADGRPRCFCRRLFLQPRRNSPSSSCWCSSVAFRPSRLCVLLADLGIPIAVVIMSAVRLLFTPSGVDAQMLAIPAEKGIVTPPPPAVARAAVRPEPQFHATGGRVRSIR